MATSTTPKPYTADPPENSTTSVDASDIFVTEELRNRSESAGTVLLHHPSRKVPELMRRHVDADPIC